MHINSQTRVILVSSIENMLLGLIRTADMLSLSLGDSRIFFVWEMKFPYKKIFHTQKKMPVKSFTTFFEYESSILYKKSISESENVEDSN